MVVFFFFGIMYHHLGQMVESTLGTSYYGQDVIRQAIHLEVKLSQVMNHLPSAAFLYASFLHRPLRLHSYGVGMRTGSSTQAIALNPIIFPPIRSVTFTPSHLLPVSRLDDLAPRV